MADWGPLASFVVLVISGLIGAYVGKKRGVPGLNAEIEERKDELLDTLRDRLDVALADFAACKLRLASVETKNVELEERVKNNERELLELLRDQRERREGGR